MKIHNHEIEGVFSQDAKFKARSKFENVLEDQIRAMGRVPVLDMSTQWYTHWDEEKRQYGFKLVMFAVYVGKRKAREEICGWEHENGRLVYF